jgi:hypothetical protein
MPAVVTSPMRPESQRVRAAPLVRDRTLVRVIAEQALATLVSTGLQLPADAGAGSGFIGVVANSCGRGAAPGLKLALSPEPPGVVYGYGFPPDPSRTETSGAPSFAGAYTIPPGQYTLEARRDGAPVSRLQVVVEAGSGTFVNLVPSPLP